ncbi:hypothetical protein SFUMM280S_08790 [Streptomyces fumanus]
MNKAFGPETRYVSTIGLSQIAGAQMLHVYRPRHSINCGQARTPLGFGAAAAFGVAKADPEAQVLRPLRGTTTSSSCWRNWPSARSTRSRTCMCWSTTPTWA